MLNSLRPSIRSQIFLSSFNFRFVISNFTTSEHKILLLTCCSLHPRMTFEKKSILWSLDWGNLRDPTTRVSHWWTWRGHDMKWNLMIIKHFWTSTGVDEVQWWWSLFPHEHTWDIASLMKSDWNFISGRLKGKKHWKVPKNFFLPPSLNRV